MAKQVFNSLTEYIQGPCQGNQQTLAHSRLWDAVVGFLHVFAQLQLKLSKGMLFYQLNESLLSFIIVHFPFNFYIEFEVSVKPLLLLTFGLNRF